MSHRVLRLLVAVIVAVVVVAPRRGAFESRLLAGDQQQPELAGVPQLQPTPHPPLPLTAEEAWLVPATKAAPTAAERAFVEASAGISAAEFSRAIDLLGDKRLASSPLAGWTTYYIGLAQLRASRAADATRTLEPLVTSTPESVVAELAARAFADAADAAGDLPRSLETVKALAERKTAAPDEVLKRLAEVASRAGEGGVARSAWTRLYYEYPLSPFASLAEPVVAEARAAAGAAAGQVFERDLARAESLFSARRYQDARDAFERLSPQAKGDANELADLRIAECDYFAGRYTAAMTRLAPWLDRASRRAEARFFHLSSLHAIDRDDEYVAAARSLVSNFPESSWAEDTLNNLATYYIRADDDAAAADVFKQIVTRYPQSRYAERAAWRYGWWQYKIGELKDAAQIFEAAAARSPRSDYRPAWVYWAGRARESIGDQDLAQARYRLVVADYRHSYYGRLATERLAKHADRAMQTRTADRADTAVRSSASPPVTAEPPNADIIRRLLALGLWNEALDELRYAQRTWGTSPRIEATMAWVYSKEGDLRRAITTMKRAYPQYMSDGGEKLPRPLAEVIFPLSYWTQIRRHSVAHRLDPHVVAALIAQESTFQADARSAANAWGLMQIIPSTGRRLARAEGIRRFTTSKLTDPEVNIRLGTRYFASLVDRFAGTHYALASYNAGESRVVRWRAERPGLPREEFIDDIPFPETQNYVKKILGTAADYRSLYPVKGARTADSE